MRGLSLVRQPIFASVILALTVGLVVADAVRLGVLEPFEMYAYDWLVTHRGLVMPPQELVFVDFDNDTLGVVGGFPVPRSVLTELVEKVAAGEPDLIGLDWILSERRTPAEDRKFAEAIEKAGNVILADVFSSHQLLGNEPLPEFEAKALDVAFANIAVDKDGVIRRLFLGVEKPGGDAKTKRVWLSFPAALMTYHQHPAVPPSPGPGVWHFGATEIPLDETENKSALIGYWSSEPVQTVPARRVLESDFDSKVFRDKIVLVGQSNSEAKDSFATPIFRFHKSTEARETCGTLIHAAALSTLLKGKTVRIMGNGRVWGLNLLLIWVVVALILGLRPLYSILEAIAVSGATFLLAWYLFFSHGVWMKVVSAETGILLALPAGLGYRFVQQRGERRAVMGLLERYISPEVATQVWKRHQTGEKVLRGEQRTATVLFSDIRDFTRNTAHKPSDEVLGWLNHYLSAMHEVIRANGGFLNKFIGDGIMVVFGAPLSAGVKEDACRAVRTALQMLDRVRELNLNHSSAAPKLKIEIRIGVGIHTGPLTAGNVGSRDRLEYSVIGETVNLASRLEALTKGFKRSVVLSPQTWELVRDQFKTAPLGEAEVRGFTGKIPLYTVDQESSW